MKYYILAPNYPFTFQLRLSKGLNFDINLLLPVIFISFRKIIKSVFIIRLKSRAAFQTKCKTQLFCDHTLGNTDSSEKSIIRSSKASKKHERNHPQHSVFSTKYTYSSHLNFIRKTRNTYNLKHGKCFVLIVF